MKRSPRAKRPMTKRFLLPMMMFLKMIRHPVTMMMFLKMIRHPVTMMKRHLHLRKRPSPSTKKLHLRKRPSTKKLHLRKRPSTRKLLLRKRPSTRKLLLRKRPSTRKLLLRNLSQRTTLRMSTTNDNGEGSVSGSDGSDYDSGIEVDWLEDLEGWLGFPVPMAALGEHHAASESESE